MPGAIWAVASRNRHRYGGYIVHLGIVVLFVGVAASSSFESKQDVQLRPGESTTVDGYEVTYVMPTVERNKDTIIFGAELDVKKDGKEFAQLTPTRRYHQPSTGTRTIQAYFQGEATSEVGLKAGWKKDFWTSLEPNTANIQKRAKMADERFRGLMALVAQRVQKNPGEAAKAAQFATDVQNKTTDQIIGLYVKRADPVTFRIIISPMVTWIWAGAIIGILGALFALWPARDPRRRKAAVKEEEPA